MKTTCHHSLLLALLFLAAAPLARGETAANSATLYQEGVNAYEAQNWAVAAEKFGQVFQQTRNPRAEYFLRNAKLKLAQGVPSETLEKKLSKVILPSVEFAETPLPEVLDFLRRKTGELTNGTVQPNLLYKRDPANPAVPVVTLKLSNIPVTEVIRYLGQLTQTKFKYETHAIIGVPASGAAGAPAS